MSDAASTFWGIKSGANNSMIVARAIVLVLFLTTKASLGVLVEETAVGYISQSSSSDIHLNDPVSITLFYNNATSDASGISTPVYYYFVPDP